MRFFQRFVSAESKWFLYTGNASKNSGKTPILSKKGTCKTRKSQTLSMIGLACGVLLAAVITCAGGSIVASLSAESNQSNRGFASGTSTGSFGVNASTTFPRAIDVAKGYFLLNLIFTISLPANVSNISIYYVDVGFYPGPTPSFGQSKCIGEGQGDYPSTQIRYNLEGMPMGGTGHGTFNITMWVTLLKSNVPQSQSWLSFTSQIDTNLSIALESCENFTDTYGTLLGNYSYSLVTFQGITTTFYMTNPSVGTFLACDGITFIIIVALLFFVKNEKRLGVINAIVLVIITFSILAALILLIGDFLIENTFKITLLLNLLGVCLFAYIGLLVMNKRITKK